MSFVKISAFLCFLLVFNVFSQESKELVFGQTGSFTGPLGLYGNLIKNSISACFKSINEAGGVQGLILSLESLEDQGNPILARKNVKSMMDKKIDMFLGCMGTRSILNILPLIQNKSIAMFFPWAGHDSFEDKSLSNMISGLGDLKPQLEEIVKKVVDKRHLSKIAIFSADDDFSLQAAKYLEKLLQDRDIKPVEVASYNRLTVDVKSAVNKIIAADPKVVVCIATSMPTVKFISNFFKQGHYATEFVGVDSTLFVDDILKDKGAHFSFSSSVPDPRTSDLEIAKKYRRDIDKYYPDDSYNVFSFAYYISAEIIVKAIKNIEGAVTKEKIIKQIENMKDFDLGGFKINFDVATRHAFGSDVTLINGL